MNLQHLSDIHTGRHAQRVKHDVKRASVGQERHILNRKHTGNNTLVAVTSCHLITNRNLTLLGNVNTHGLVHARRQLVSVLPGKYLCIHDDSVCAVRHLKGGIADFSCLLAENSAQQALLCGQLSLALGSNLSYQDISCADFCADTDNTALIQVFQGILAHARYVAGDFFRSQLGVTGFRLILLNMDGGVDVFLNQTLGQKNRILVIVAFPCHESDERVLAKGNLAVISGRTVCDYLSGLHVVVLIYNRLLVVTVALVASLKLGQMVHIAVAVAVPADDDFIGCGALYHPCIPGYHTHAGVNSRLGLDTSTNGRSLCGQKGHCLTLHVGTHQGPVGIVVLQERNHGRSNGEYHLGRYVHQVNGLFLELGCLCTETSGYIVVYEVAFLIQGLICLCHNEVIFLVSSQVHHLIRYPRARRVSGLIHHAVRSLNKAVLVHSGIGCQRVNQTDVRTFRRLNGAHTSIVGVVYISNLESGTVPGQTAGAQGGETALMGQLSQGVVLVHELGQLGASEELLYSRGHGLDVD